MEDNGFIKMVTRIKKAHCKICFHPGFWRLRDTELGRPQFQCDKCKHIWTCGNSGGEYMGNQMGDKK